MSPTSALLISLPAFWLLFWAAGSGPFFSGCSSSVAGFLLLFSFSVALAAFLLVSLLTAFTSLPASLLPSLLLSLLFFFSAEI